VSERKIPEPDLQISFYHQLQEIRRTHLLDALLATVADLETTQIDQQLAELTSRSGLRKVAGWGLRGELVFGVP